MRSALPAFVALLLSAPTTTMTGCEYERSAVLDSDSQTRDQVTPSVVDFGEPELMPLTLNTSDVRDEVIIDAIADSVLHARGRLRKLPEVLAGELRVSIDGAADMRFVLAYRPGDDDDWFTYYHADHRSRPWLSYFNSMAVRNGTVYYEGYPESAELGIDELGEEIELAIFAVPYGAPPGSYEYSLSASAR